MIDIEKFICSLLADHPVGVTVREDIHKALKDQGLEYKGGKIISIEDKTELKESEGERIRKSLIRNFTNQHSSNFPTVDGFTREQILAWLEKKGESKHIDKVEPKFKVGDWVVSPNGVYWHIDAIRNGRYQVSAQSGECADWSLDTNIYHKFTIQDAKDGDVLVASDCSIFLFKGTIGYACKHYVALTTGGAVKFNKGLEHYWETSTAVHPATKKQRDLLFKAMSDAGYTFDFEKKELKKIEQTSSWSKEDEIMLGKCIDIASGYYYPPEERQPMKDWLKSLKDKYTWKPSDEQLHYLSWIANIELGDSVVEQEVSKHLNESLEDLKKLRKE